MFSDIRRLSEGLAAMEEHMSAQEDASHVSQADQIMRNNPGFDPVFMKV